MGGRHAIDGDQVVYHSESTDGYIRHTVVEETESGYVTKGERLPETDVEYRDEYVTEDNYVGTVADTSQPPG